MSLGRSAPALAEPRWFATTHWSVVLAAGQGASPNAEQALERLCRTYWRPLYAYVRQQGKTIEDAQDLTQEFFARFIEKEFVGLADPARGRFRSFLLACFKNFVAEQHRHAGRLRRGGGQTFVPMEFQPTEDRLTAEAEDNATPEFIYERRWALTLLETTMNRLGAELTAARKEHLFTELKGLLWGETAGAPYAVLAARLGLTEGALKVTVHRLRQRFRDLLREEVAHTVADATEVDEELRHLIGIVRGALTVTLPRKRHR